jgi:hypothetical protein
VLPEPCRPPTASSTLPSGRLTLPSLQHHVLETSDVTMREISPFRSAGKHPFLTGHGVPSVPTAESRTQTYRCHTAEDEGEGNHFSEEGEGDDDDADTQARPDKDSKPTKPGTCVCCSR